MLVSEQKLIRHPVFLNLVAAFAWRRLMIAVEEELKRETQLTYEDLSQLDRFPSAFSRIISNKELKIIAPVSVAAIVKIEKTMTA